MTVEELEQLVMDALEGFQPEASMTPETKLSEVGIDSLEVVELILILEEKLPGHEIDDYVPELSDTIRDVTVALHKGLKE